MQEICELRKLLEARSKHENYQMLPPALIEKEPTLISFSHSRRLDNKRYDWFSEKLDFNNKKVLDIGANIGYFSFRLATEKNAKITTYEPFIEHSIAIEKCKKILGLSDYEFTNNNHGISLNDIEKLKGYDIALFFNVIQHAGEDFDENLVRDINEWNEYARIYLSKIKKITKHLIFQTGYTWLGHNGKLCSDDNILDFTINLLNNAGWEIEYCGLVKNYKNPNYIDYKIKEGSRNFHPLVNIWVETAILLRNKFLKSDIDYRFLERPIFICK